MLTKNNVYLGDCLEIMSEIESKTIDLILTDIPYDKVNRKSNGLRNLDKENADILTFNLQEFLSECNRVCRGSIYVFCGTEQVSEIRKTLVKFGLSTRHCVWEKNNPSPMNSQYIWLSSIENCVFAKNKNATFNEHCKSAAWRFPNGRSKVHPTEKPLALFQYLVETSSRREDIVLDPCAGSCTTAIACLNTNRNYICIEKDERYYEVGGNRVKEHLEKLSV